MRKSVIAVLCLLLVFGATNVFADGMTSGDMLAAARANILQAPAGVAKLLLDEGNYVFIDVREPTETKMGFIPGAFLSPAACSSSRLPAPFWIRTHRLSCTARQVDGLLSLPTRSSRWVIPMSSAWPAAGVRGTKQVTR